MKWHAYGQVEIALREEGDQPITLARYRGPISRPGAPVTEYDSRVFRQVDPVHELSDHAESCWVDDATGEPVTDDAPVELFDAAAVLCWHDFDCFRAADDAMGDRNP